MSVRYEGADARYTSITIAREGEEIGDDVVPEGKAALVFNYDEVFYLVGTTEQLRNMLRRARAQLWDIDFESEDAGA